MTNFTAIDFETAHGKRWSICQVGLVRVENDVITDEFSILVQPPNNFYWDWFIGIHHITQEMTRNAPTFNQIWHLVEPFIKNQSVVAHNGFSFDFDVLAKTLEYYGLTIPEYEKHCTYRIYNDNLFSLCQRFQIALNHHEALSDARACAKLFLLNSLKSKNEKAIKID
jgi:DNA polymerase-3 subunit epsilon